MPVGSETFAVGQYTVTYNSLAMGIMKGDGGVPTIVPRFHEAPINNTDKYGRTKIDGIYQGADVVAMFTCLEYKAAVTAALWPWGTIFAQGLIGRLKYNLASALVLTVVASTPAATTGPASITATKAILATDYNWQLLFGPLLREMPIKLDLLPYDSSGAVVYAVTA